MNKKYKQKVSVCCNATETLTLQHFVCVCSGRSTRDTDGRHQIRSLLSPTGINKLWPLYFSPHPSYLLPPSSVSLPQCSFALPPPSPLSSLRMAPSPCSSFSPCPHWENSDHVWRFIGSLHFSPLLRLMDCLAINEHAKTWTGPRSGKGYIYKPAHTPTLRLSHAPSLLAAECLSWGPGRTWQYANIDNTHTHIYMSITSKDICCKLVVLKSNTL